MVFGLLATAHAARVLARLHALGGTARFTPLRDAVGIGDQQLSRALKYLNTQGLVSARVLGGQSRPLMQYGITVLGSQVLEVLHAWHEVVHGIDNPAARMADQELEALVSA